MYRRPKRLIVAQYSPPPYISLLAGAELLGEGKRAIAAQVVDLAVRKVISISRPAEKRRSSGFTITVTGNSAAENPDEQALIVALFNLRLPMVGESMRVAPRRNRGLGVRLQRPHRVAVARLVAAGLARERNLLVKLLMPWRKQPVVPTEKAFYIVDHLWGIHDYVRLAERDRLAMLQSPEGALRSPLGELDVLRVYERLLPYAVLFGLEKQWAKELDLRARELTSDALDVLDVVEVAALALDLVDLIDIADALEGVGAIFGGIVEFIGGLAP